MPWRAEYLCPACGRRLTSAGLGERAAAIEERIAAAWFGHRCARPWRRAWFSLRRARRLARGYRLVRARRA